ncbi:hypothetical protein L1N85_20650 [Paenibacillus alkaliterrae]|uniref:hypothetical protein n=1 Tax=Paenibacillus alkaliterrae TaxID=320909 RepID=UPI001F218EB8|nr:hypothetical protein [Paenibacillus alkaliterrae]MCF2940805.1 hypothetical protein [Paenibacillus alkaliterrae]
MEPQQTGKRSIALPITLVILVFSLIGNVFLYSQFLQHRQDNKFKAGQTIYAAAIETRLYFEELLRQVDALVQSERLEDRQEAKFLAGKASMKGSKFVELVAEAERLAESKDGVNVEHTLTYVKNVDSALQTIGSYSGLLNDEDQAYLLSLKASLEKMAGVMSGFNSNIGDNRIAVIRLSSGPGWIELVDQLQQHVKEQLEAHAAK